MKELYNRYKLLFWIIIIVLAYFLIVRPAWKWWQRTQKTKGAKQELSDVTTTIANLQAQGIKPTYQPSQYSTWANELVKSFDGCGTDWTVVKNVFSKLKNNLDLALLLDSYGIKTYDKCSLTESITGDFTGSLSEALVDELDGDERDEINKLLMSNNINYSF